MACFNDEPLKQKIGEVGYMGDCDYCGSENVKIANGSGLSEMFKELVDAQCEEADAGFGGFCGVGSTLAELLDEDLELFSELVPEKRRSDILDSILNSTHYDPKERDLYRVPVEGFWVRRENSPTHVGSDGLWAEFSSHIKYERRFVLRRKAESFLDQIADPAEWMREYLDDSAINLPSGTRLFRARLEIPGQKFFDSSQMGAPPAELTRAGRANSKGIPVLYAADDQATAISEVRPWKGAHVTVVECDLNENLTMVDLADVKYLTKEPFAFQNIGYEVDKLHLVIRLANDLAKPISTNEAEIEYLPTQSLTEVVKDWGFDGMWYPSAMGTG